MGIGDWGLGILLIVFWPFLCLIANPTVIKPPDSDAMPEPPKLGYILSDEPDTYKYVKGLGMEFEVFNEFGFLAMLDCLFL